MTDYIPDERAEIFWSVGDNGRITGVCVVDAHDVGVRDQMAERFGDSNGAHSADWLTDMHPVCNPAGLFGFLAFVCGFRTPGVARDCLTEFAQIASADWARQMLAAVKRER